MLSRNAYIVDKSQALLFQLSRFVWPVHAIAAILMMSLTLVYSELPALLIWTGWMLLASAVNAAVSLRGIWLAKAARDLTPWAKVFTASNLVMGLSWAWFSLTLVPESDSELRNFITLALGGIVLMLTGTQNLQFRPLAISIGAIVLARCTGLLLNSASFLDPYAALVLCIFLGLMLGLGWMLRSFVRDGFGLEWDNAHLTQQLQRQTVELEASRKAADAANEAKSRFLAQASHDLRQPLHSMGLHLASLSDEPLSPETRGVITRIQHSIEVLSKLFSSLLDITLLDTHQLAPKPSAFNVSALLADIAEEYAIAAQAENMAVSAASKDVLIFSDPLLVRRILQNLVSNAIRHSEGGDVFLSAKNEGSAVTLTVRDTGKGLEDENRRRVLQTLADGRANESGLGLGLTIVRRLADVLGVSITIDSSEEAGTAFTIGPFEPAETITQQHAPEPLSEEKHSAAALVVDDDPATRDATSALLASWGWRVDARAGLDDAAVNALAPPDLIISDFELAFGESGLHAVTKIRQQHGDIPAIIITGSVLPETRDAIKREGLVMLHKPVRPAQLRSAMIAVLG